MKKDNRLRKRVLIILCAVLLLVLGLAIWAFMSTRDRVTVNGIDLMSRGSVNIGNGKASYDSASGVLTLSNVCVENTNTRYMVYSTMDLTVRIDGMCMLYGRDYGIYAKGNVTIAGNGIVLINGKKAGVCSRGEIKLPQYAECIISSDKAALSSAGDMSVRDKSILTDRDGNEIGLSAVKDYLRVTPPVRLTYKTVGGTPLDIAEYRRGDSPGEYEATQRDGFVFAGWYTGNNYAEEADPAQPMEQDCVVYAMWDKDCDIVLKGIDVSAHQKEIDWETAGKADIDFVIARAGFRGYGETGSLNPDAYMDANLDGAEKAGFRTGVYFYTQATTPDEAREEAELVLSLLDGRHLELPVFYDLEYAENADGYVGRLYNAGLDTDGLYGLCEAFCSRIREAGYTPMVYANCGFLSKGLGEKLDENGIGVWLAHYTGHTYYEHRYEAWQYSSKGSIDGIEGGVDMNEYYIVLTEEERAAREKAEAEKAAREAEEAEKAKEAEEKEAGEAEEAGKEAAEKPAATPQPTLAPPVTPAATEEPTPKPTVKSIG